MRYQNIKRVMVICLTVSSIIHPVSAALHAVAVASVWRDEGGGGSKGGSESEKKKEERKRNIGRERKRQ